MTTGDEIDPNAILAALGVAPDATCTRLTGGIDARMWRVDTPGARYALRLLGPSQHRQAEREQAVGRWAANHDLPVPGVIAAGTWHNRPAYLMEWADGQVLATMVLAAASGMETATHLGRAFGATQARLHQLRPPVDAAIVERDWRRWTRVEGELAASLDAFPDASSSLLHLDYHPLNVLVANGEVSAVLDWANVHTGDPRVDLARTLSILELMPMPDPAMAELVRQFANGWRVGYAQVAGAFGIPPLLRWWAGAAMEQDLAPKVGDPSAPWLDHAYLARIRAWTDAARRQTLAGKAVT